MKSQGVKPYNGNMHMICGATTDIADEPLIAQFWADNMLGDRSVGRKPMAIRDAWYAAGTQAYAIGITNGMSSFYPNPTTYAVAAGRQLHGGHLCRPTLFPLAPVFGATTILKPYFHSEKADRSFFVFGKWDGRIFASLAIPLRGA